MTLCLSCISHPANGKVCSSVRSGLLRTVLLICIYLEKGRFEGSNKYRFCFKIERYTITHIKNGPKVAKKVGAKLFPLYRVTSAV